MNAPFEAVGWRAIRLSDVRGPVRLMNVLHNAGIKTVGELADMPRSRLLREPHAGPVTVHQATEMVAAAMAGRLHAPSEETIADLARRALGDAP